MFKEIIAQLLDLFEENTSPILDEDEKKCIRVKYSNFFNEGVKFQPGGRFGKGRIVMTKHVDSTDFNDFFYELITSIKFPGVFSIDAHGFVETSQGEPVFIFGSKNSSIPLWNEEQSVYLQR